MSYGQRVYIEEYLERYEYVGYMFRVREETEPHKVLIDKLDSYQKAVGWVKLANYTLIRRGK